jgi:hypothetical protein
MRTRQAQQLQADILSRLDETGSPKPAPGESLEWINQAWAKVYRKLIQAGVQWNMRETQFTTIGGQDSYASSFTTPTAAPWTMGVGGLTIGFPGSGMSTGTYPLTFAGGTTAPGATTPSGTLTVAGGITVSTSISAPGCGYLTTPTVTVSGAGGAGPGLTCIPVGDYWKTQALAVQSGQFWRPVHRFQQEKEYDYQQAGWSWPEPGLFDTWGGTSDASGYDGTFLKLIPPPAVGMLLRHRWYPAPQRLVNPTDVFDGIAGGELVVILQACAEAALQTEQFELADRFESKAAAELVDLMSSLRDRNVGEAPMARVVRGRPTGTLYGGRWWRW